MRFFVANGFRCVVGLAGALALTASASAAVKEAELGVSIKIEADCTVAADPLDFGTHSILAADVSEQSAITVTCTPGVKYKIGLDKGLGDGSTVTTRKMTNVTDPLATVNYGLFVDKAATENWGDEDVVGTGVNAAPVTSTGDPDVHTVFGVVPKNQAATVGDYTDTVKISVSY